MSFTLWISRRLKLNGSGQGANATGVVIAVTGVAIALVVMELTIAIVLGFKHQISERILGFDGEVWVLPAYDPYTGTTEATMLPDAHLQALVDSLLPGSSTYMKFSQPGILKTDTDFSGIYFTGFDRGYSPDFQRGNISEGEYPDYSDSGNANRIVVSRLTADALGKGIGDRIDACFFVNEAIKARKFEIAGIYESGFSDYDRTIAYAALPTLQKIAAADSLSGTQYIIELPGGSDIEAAAETLQQGIIDSYQRARMEHVYPVDNVRHTGALYFNWLDLLDTNVVVIFVLMLCVSGFTLVSSMFIIILERIPTIGILRALGTRKGQIRSIFVYMTLKIVGIGLLIGNAVGLGLLWIQHTWHVMKLDPEMYYLRYVPVEIHPWHIVYLNLGVVLVSWLILILPSRLASSISPASTMRFE